MYKFFIFFLFILPSICSSDDITTIEIDGSNLPNSSGEVKEGKRIFALICSECHGHSGEGLTAPELVGKSLLTGKKISKTIGNFWPYAPKIFDFIKRAKRTKNGEYFSNSEVFALTGYLLKLNGLYSKKKIDKEGLSNIIMPNKDGFISTY
jgi:cytochrome c